MEKTEKPNLRIIIVLQLAIVIYSLSGVCIKLAGQSDFLSFRFFSFYGCAMLILLLYAVVWQQILKRISLSTAYASRATGVIWGVVWGVIIFNEGITWNMILGTLVILLGLYLVVTSNE